MNSSIRGQEKRHIHQGRLQIRRRHLPSWNSSQAVPLQFCRAVYHKSMVHGVDISDTGYILDCWRHISIPRSHVPRGTPGFESLTVFARLTTPVSIDST